MPSPLESLIASGTKLWLDSIDPVLVDENKALGATGATSNPIIVKGILATGRFDDEIAELLEAGEDDESVAWEMTNRLVKRAQEQFAGVHDRTDGNDGYVSFELDPLLEDVDCTLTESEKAARYVELGLRWAAQHDNRMIKVPGTPGGLAALEELAAAGVTLNVTLLFTERQYEIARENIWRGAQRRAAGPTGNALEGFKSVYSIFVSRIDVYTQQHVPELSDAAQGQVGIVNAKRLWKSNNRFWAEKGLPLDQEIIFASTGTKNPNDPPDKYIGALAGADIQTNPPEMNAKIQAMEGKTFTRQVDQLPPDEILAEIDEKVDFQQLEKVLMEEGLAKFADPQKELLELIAVKRAALQDS
jgi:transaldolase